MVELLMLDKYLSLYKSFIIHNLFYVSSLEVRGLCKANVFTTICCNLYFFY